MTIHKHNEDGGNGRPDGLTLGHKIMGIVVALLSSVTSVGGSYYVFKAVTQVRLESVERSVEKNDTRIGQMEQFGHPDHERRIQHLEQAKDDQQRAQAAMQAKLDVLQAISERNEKKLDAISTKLDQLKQ